MRTYKSSLGGVLFGQTRGAIFALLYGHPGQAFYVRQIAAQIGISVGSVQRELEALSKVELISRSRVGNQVFYRANEASPVYGEMRGLVAKTLGVFQLLRSALLPLAMEIRVAFVFGSVARQEEKAESDVDLLVAGDASLSDILSQLEGLETTLGRSINPVVYTVREFKSKVADGNHFLNSVIRGEKVFLFGDDNELAEMGRVRVAKAGAHKPRRDIGAA